MSAKLPSSLERSASGGSPRSMLGLPGVLREIAEVAGVEAALIIARLRGGARMKIPSQIAPGSWLALAIGEDKAKAVSFHFTSGHSTLEIDVPLGPVGLRARTVGDVRQLLREGVSAEETARRVGVSSRNVRRVRKAMRAEAAANRDGPANPASDAPIFPQPEKDV